MRLRFGAWVFDSGARQLERQGRSVELSPKAFQLLSVLLDSRPRALSKEELRDRLWPGTFVSHTSLARVVSEVRAALEESSRAPRFVRTLHGFGYAFSAEVEELGEAAAAAESEPSGHALLWGSREIPLAEGENLLGRDPGCRLRIVSPRVSRRHARILVSGERAVLEDLASKNGTFLGAKPVAGPIALTDGDEILVGHELLVYCALRATGTTRTGRLR